MIALILVVEDLLFNPKGIDRGMAGWPMERPEIAEMNP